MWNYWCCMKKKLLETGKHKSIRRNFWNTFLVLDIHHATVFTNKTVCGSLFVTSDLPVLLYITWQMVSHKGPSGKTSQETIWRGTFKILGRWWNRRVKTYFLFICSSLNETELMLQLLLKDQRLVWFSYSLFNLQKDPLLNQHHQTPELILNTPT